MKEALGINFCQIRNQAFLFPQKPLLKGGTKFYTCGFVIFLPYSIVLRNRQGLRILKMID
jgi:hypothetical protein